MDITLLAQHVGATIITRNGELRLVLASYRVLEDTAGPGIICVPPRPITEIYVLGAGAKAQGFQHNAWVIKHAGKWYLRPAGNGTRGQYYRIKNCWTTQVVLATRTEAARLNAAHVCRTY